MASITFTIPGVQLLNQLVESSNPRDDCVFTSCAALVNALTGSHYTGSQIKAMDNNYGPSYVGFASAANLVDTLAKLGVKLARVPQPTQRLLLDELHWQISHYHQPCLVTMPSQWNSAPLASGWNPRAYRGYSHVGLACGVGSGMLRVMNPWGGFWQDQSDAWWSQRLLEGEIWVGSRLPTPAPAKAPPAPSQGLTGASSSNPVPVPVTVAQLQAKIAAALKALA